MTSPDPNELDELMARLGTQYADICDKDPVLHTDKDIDIVIAYQRKHRVMVEQGVRTKAKREKGPSVAMTQEFLDKIMPKAAPVAQIKRRV